MANVSLGMPARLTGAGESMPASWPEELREAAGAHAAQLAVGTAFVAKGRHRAGNPVPDTDLACEVLCGGLTSKDAAALVDRAFVGLPTDAHGSPYRVLQQRLRDAFARP